MKKLLILIMSLFLFTGCESDESLDPMQINTVSKGSYLILRGDTFDFLLDNGYAGDLTAETIDSENLVFTADFLAADINTLGSVEVFARYRNQTRVSVGKFEGSKWVVGKDSKYPRATVSIPGATVLSKLNLTKAALAETVVKNLEEGAPTFINLEVDIVLKDGTLVPAEAIVNDGLFASLTFFPAHSLQYLVSVQE